MSEYAENISLLNRVTGLFLAVANILLISIFTAYRIYPPLNLSLVARQRPSVSLALPRKERAEDNLFIVKRGVSSRAGL